MGMLEAVRIRSVWSASCCDDATFIPLQGGFSNTVSAAEPLAAAAGYIGNMHTPWHPKVRSSPSPRSDSNLVRSLDQPEECALRIGFAARNPGPRLAPRERRALKFLKFRMVVAPPIAKDKLLCRPSPCYPSASTHPKHFGIASVHGCTSVALFRYLLQTWTVSSCGKDVSGNTSVPWEGLPLCCPPMSDPSCRLSVESAQQS